MSMAKTYYPASYRRKLGDLKEEPPGVHPYTQDLMLALHQAVIEENRRQSAKKYSLRDERGETFGLLFWEDYHNQEYTLIPDGTPLNEKNLSWAMSELLSSMEECNFGRWTGSARIRSMDELRAQIQRIGEQGGKRDEG